MKIFNKITGSGCKITPVSHLLTLPEKRQCHAAQTCGMNRFADLR